MKTTFTYTSIDGQTTPPVSHQTKQAAINYAIELSSRMQGECRILGEYDEVIAVYENGEPLQKAA